MATIRAVIPAKLLSQLRATADPDESVEETGLPCGGTT
jgi:hypothetical protein